MLTLVLAQQDGPAAAEPARQALPTIVELFQQSLVINSILLALSVLAVALFAFFLLTVNSRALAPSDLTDEIKKLVDRGKHEAAGDLCRAHRRVFVASIIQRCVENAGRGHGVIMEMLDTEGRRRADVLWNRVSYLADISNVAPMLGLLGTVLGMIKAFFALEDQSFSVESAGLARGVGEAMSTTMFGLLVGITALVFYSIIKARATRALADAEQAVHGVADRIRREPPKPRTRESRDMTDDPDAL